MRHTELERLLYSVYGVRISLFLAGVYPREAGDVAMPWVFQSTLIGRADHQDTGGGYSDTSFALKRMSSLDLHVG